MQLEQPHFTVTPNGRLPDNVQAYLNKPDVRRYRKGNYGYGLHKIIEMSYHSGLKLYVKTYGCSSSKETGDRVDRELAKWLRLGCPPIDPKQWDKNTVAIIDFFREMHWELLVVQIPVIFNCPLWDSKDRKKTHTCADFLVRCRQTNKVYLCELKTGALKNTDTLVNFKNLGNGMEIKANPKNAHHLQLYFTDKGLKEGGLNVDGRYLVNSVENLNNSQKATVQHYPLEPWTDGVLRQNVKGKTYKPGGSRDTWGSRLPERKKQKTLD